MTKHRKGKPTKYRFRNWPAYDNALKQRGKIVFMITKDVRDIWLESEPDEKLPGVPVVFTDKSIEICLQIRELFHLPLRQTEGFTEGLFESIGIDLPIPGHTLLSKRAKGLGLKITRYHKRGKPSQATIKEILSKTRCTDLKQYSGQTQIKKRQKSANRSYNQVFTPE